MQTFNITLTNAEAQAMTSVTDDLTAYVDNAIRSRCRTAVDEIAQVAVSKCFETSTQIPATKDELVELAFQNGWVKTVAELKAAAEAARAAAEQAAQGA